jgi:hypothetical protein
MAAVPPGFGGIRFDGIASTTKHTIKSVGYQHTAIDCTGQDKKKKKKKKPRKNEAFYASPDIAGLFYGEAVN